MTQKPVYVGIQEGEQVTAWCPLGSQVLREGWERVDQGQRCCNVETCACRADSETFRLASARETTVFWKRINEQVSEAILCAENNW